MGEERDFLRVSDGERQAAADRLRAAHDEGRLDFSEYDSRLGQAYSSVTYADLDRLFADLPATAPAPSVARPPDMRQALEAAVARQMARPRPAPDVPLILRILWINWAVVVTINLAVWLVITVGSSEPVYFWPVWLAVPGMLLCGATAAARAVRTHRRAAIER